MRSNLVGVKSFVKLGIMVGLARFSSCAGYAAFAVADDTLCFNKTVFYRRSNCKRRAGGVAARVCNKAFALYVVSEQFGQTVCRLFVKLFVKKCSAVPLGVFVLAFKAEISSEVDKLFARANVFFCKFLRKSVGKGGKDYIALFNNGVLIFAYHIVKKFV